MRGKRADSARFAEAENANRISDESLRIAQFVKSVMEHQAAVLRGLRHENNFASRIAASYERAS